MIEQLRVLPALWPITTMYVTGVAVMIAVTQMFITPALGMLAFGFAATLLILFLLRKEVQTVHHLVNSQHDDLVNRVTQLVETLQAAQVKVPEDPAQKDKGAT